jgi:hypothetical protein
MEVLLHQLCQPSDAQRRLGCSLLHQKLHNLHVQFVAASWASLQRNQAGQPGLLEGGLRMIERGAREPEGLRRLRNRMVVDLDLPEHLVLHLDHVVGVEEVAVLKQRMAHILGTRVERALLSQSLPFVLVGLLLRHSRLPDRASGRL